MIDTAYDQLKPHYQAKLLQQVRSALLGHGSAAWKVDEQTNSYMYENPINREGVCVSGYNQDEVREAIAKVMAAYGITHKDHAYWTYNTGEYSGVGMFIDRAAFRQRLAPYLATKYGCGVGDNHNVLFVQRNHAFPSFSVLSEAMNRCGFTPKQIALHLQYAAWQRNDADGTMRATLPVFDGQQGAQMQQALYHFFSYRNVCNTCRKVEENLELSVPMADYRHKLQPLINAALGGNVVSMKTEAVQSR